jgi:hypothetical protein
MHSLGRITSKKSDYKMCNLCGHLNWHENINCVVCDYENSFDIDEARISAWCDHEAEYQACLDENTSNIVYEV